MKKLLSFIATMLLLTTVAYADTNSYRAAQGLSKLIYSQELTDYANSRLNAMCKAQDWSHDGFRATSGYLLNTYTKVGENLSRGWESNQVTQKWVESPSHNENLIGAYTHYGHYELMCYSDYNKGIVLWVAEIYGHKNVQDIPEQVTTIKNTIPVTNEKVLEVLQVKQDNIVVLTSIKTIIKLVHNFNTYIKR